MASDQYDPNDLTSVLRTLSALANPNAQPTTPNTLFNHHGSQADGTEDDQYQPPDAFPPSIVHAPAIPQQAAGRPTTVTQHGDSFPSQQSASKPAGSTIDPSTITSWPSALQFVMRTVAQNEGLQQRIRRLIQSQHQHERQWWQGREALLKKQSERDEKKKQLDEVLRSVGAPIDDAKVISTADEDQAELTRYDSKVYKASVKMAEAMNAELRALQIPFFTIKRNLVSDVTSKQTDNKLDSDKQHVLSQDQLSNLQRRMLDLLQDLCKE